MISTYKLEFDARMRREALMREVQMVRKGAEASGTTVKVAGPPKVHSEFFMRRFGHLVGRMKLQQA